MQTPIKTLVIGASGYIGSHLFNYYRSFYNELIGTSYQSHDDNLTFFDICQSDIEDLNLKDNGYQSVVICSGITNISYVDKFPLDSYKVNVEAILRVIQSIEKLGLPIIFISSDNVYAGQDGNYKDTDIAKPISEYGKQKYAVEQAIPSLTSKYTILRLSKVMGVSLGDKTIIDEITNQLLADNDVLAAEDLIFNPTFINDVVLAINLIQQKELYGTLNFCTPLAVSRYQLSVAIAKKLSIPVKRVQKILFSQLGGSTNRPLNTSMVASDCFSDFQYCSLDTCIDTYMTTLSSANL